MFYTSDETIERFIKEDIPYIDLTTLVLGIGQQRGKIRFTSRENAVISGSEEVTRIFQKLGVEPIFFTPSGTAVSPGDVFLEGVGSAGSLHMVWKVSMNILEYCSGIATRTKKLVEKAKGVNPKIELVTTRKVFPGTKELDVKAVIAGGGLPHRLGLSETVLIFKQHMNFLGGIDGLLNKIEEIKARACEKKVIVEVECMEDAIRLSRAGVDGLQFDKVQPQALKEMVDETRAINPKITLIGTGGINEGNVEEYAGTGVDSISTTWVYFGKPADMGVTIQ